MLFQRAFSTPSQPLDARLEEEILDSIRSSIAGQLPRTLNPLPQTVSEGARLQTPASGHATPKSGRSSHRIGADGFCARHPNFTSVLWCSTCQETLCVRCSSSHIGHSIIDAAQHRMELQRHSEDMRDPSLTNRQIQALRRNAVFNVARNQVGSMQSCLGNALDSMGNTLRSAKAVLREAGSVFARMFAGLSAHQLRIEIRKAFIRFDKDCSGYLDANELRAAFDLMGLRLSAEEVEIIMQEYDIDSSGQIDLPEFESMVRLCLKRADPKAVAAAEAAEQARQAEAASRIQRLWRKELRPEPVSGAADHETTCVSCSDAGASCVAGETGGGSQGWSEVLKETVGKTSSRARKKKTRDNKRVSSDAKGAQPSSNMPVLAKPAEREGRALFQRAKSDGAAVSTGLGKQQKTVIRKSLESEHAVDDDHSLTLPDLEKKIQVKLEGMMHDLDIRSRGERVAFDVDDAVAEWGNSSPRGSTGGISELLMFDRKEQKGNEDAVTDQTRLSRGQEEWHWPGPATAELPPSARVCSDRPSSAATQDALIAHDGTQGEQRVQVMSMQAREDRLLSVDYSSSDFHDMPNAATVARYSIAGEGAVVGIFPVQGARKKTAGGVSIDAWRQRGLDKALPQALLPRQISEDAQFGRACSLPKLQRSHFNHTAAHVGSGLGAVEQLSRQVPRHSMQTRSSVPNALHVKRDGSTHPTESDGGGGFEESLQELTLRKHKEAEQRRQRHQEQKLQIQQTAKFLEERATVLSLKGVVRPSKKRGPAAKTGRSSAVDCDDSGSSEAPARPTISGERAGPSSLGSLLSPSPPATPDTWTTQAFHREFACWYSRFAPFVSNVPAAYSGRYLTMARFWQEGRSKRA